MSLQKPVVDDTIIVTLGNPIPEAEPQNEEELNDIIIFDDIPEAEPQNAEELNDTNFSSLPGVD